MKIDLDHHEICTIYNIIYKELNNIIHIANLCSNPTALDDYIEDIEDLSVIIEKLKGCVEND